MAVVQPRSPLPRLAQLLGDRLLHGPTTVPVDETTFRGALIALYFVPLQASVPSATAGDRDLRDLYRAVNETERTLDIVQISYPDNAADDRKRFDETTDGVPWHTVPYERAEHRVRRPAESDRHRYRLARRRRRGLPPINSTVCEPLSPTHTTYDQHACVVSTHLRRRTSKRRTCVAGPIKRHLRCFGAALSELFSTRTTARGDLTRACIGQCVVG